jgi:hypothetical protein
MKKDQKYVFFGIIACYCQFCTNLGAIPIELYNSSVPFPQVQVLKTKGQPAFAGRWFSTVMSYVILDILLNHICCYVTRTDRKKSSCPQMLSPVPFAELRKCLLELAGGRGLNKVTL